ncbi:MAG: glycosyltransferase family 9 protein [Gemmatimonadales bacterium]
MASLVVQTSFLGDVVLTTPLIAELARRSAVDVLTTRPGAEMLSGNPAVRNILVYEKRDRDKGIRGFARIVGHVRHTGRYGTPAPSSDGPRSEAIYDAAYMAQGSIRSGLLTLAAGVRHRIGFDTASGRAFYTERVRYDQTRHHAERLWGLSMSDCADPPTPEQIRPRLYPGDDERRVVDRLLMAAGIARPFIALAPGSAWGTKRWPFYPELAVLISKQLPVVIIGGNGDVETGDSIVSQLEPGRGLSTAGSLSLLASAELIGRAAALVGNDSAPQHLASAMGTSTVTVYGPTTPDFGFGPLAAGSVTVGLTGLACRPCDRHGPVRCPLGHWRCMRELSSRQAFEILMQTLTSAPTI